ncbi:hypothetical protein E6P09_19060 (plasmid) [Haloferax mediterranei ATCC 33500]|uniref:Uncharacterized protein n=1 Tax=Haloferax mediterranei (strain ATCC 33500 / DSM 1411 / JCM 8866 / NBRC 14739 / NCIMB 2177 / R-4) TaxID=523841 RepID=A0A4P8PCL7_HALMT|nr:hypothetical protein [Haloferax mediterranei]MDX5989684.1 hypothetical protein [Haloferax mediterranei ATCC 33500]QCQ77414.1 hypothetical protein E6P09_19060 [Haloferax mediterranei ATCC 33500]
MSRATIFQEDTMRHIIKTVTAFFLISTWATILFSPVLTSIGLSVEYILMIGVVIATISVYLSKRRISNNRLIEENMLWQNLLIFLSVILGSGIGVLYIMKFVFGVLSDTPPEWFAIVIACFYVFLPLLLATWVIYKVNIGDTAIPPLLRINEWNRRADSGLILIVALVALTYSVNLLPAQLVIFSPILNIGALLFGLFHVVIRRIGVFHPEFETTS